MREACVGPYERRAVSTKVNSVGNDDPDILIPCRRSGCFDLKGGSRLDAVFRVFGAGVITIAPFQYSKLRLANREWFRGEDHMGSHIPIRQLRRSSVNARPRGATPSGSCRFSRIHKHLGHLPPSLPVLCFEALPPVFERNRGGCIR